MRGEGEGRQGITWHEGAAASARSLPSSAWAATERGCVRTANGGLCIGPGHNHTNTTTSLDSEKNNFSNNCLIIKGDPLPFEVAVSWGSLKNRRTRRGVINGRRGSCGLVVRVHPESDPRAGKTPATWQPKETGYSAGPPSGELTTLPPRLRRRK